MQADPQREKRERGQRQVPGQLQPLGEARHVEQAEPGVDGDHHQRDHDEGAADEAAVLVHLGRRSGEPQCGTDQAADGGGGQRHGDTADSGLHEQSVQRADPVDHPGAELRCQPAQGGRGGERQCPQRADGVAVQGFPVAVPTEPGHQGGYEHQQHAAHRHADAVAQDAPARDTGAQRDTVGPRHGRSGQQHPADAEYHPERDRQDQRAARDIAGHPGFAEVQREQQGDAQGGDGDERGRHAQDGAHGESRRQQHQAHQEHLA